MTRKHTILEGEREIAIVPEKPRVANLTLRSKRAVRMSMDEVLAILGQMIEDRCHGVSLTFNGITITLTEAPEDPPT